MAIERTPTPRIIKYGGAPLTDLNPDASVAEVVRLHSATRTELVNAHITGPVFDNGANVYEVSVKAAYKG